MKIITFTLLLLTSIATTAQSLDNLIGEIEVNSTTLKALRSQADAEKSEAHTGISISDPEVGVNYLWGKPSDLESNRFDLTVSQEFDFPSVYKYRKMIANGEANMAELRYLAERREIINTVSQLSVELSFCIAMNQLLSEKAHVAKLLTSGLQKRYATGEVSLITVNKARMALANAKYELEANRIEIDRIESELTAMNGGTATNAKAIPLSILSVNSDFESWFANIQDRCPELLIERMLAEQSAANLKLQKAQNLPKFSLGYMSERTEETTLQGFSFTMSLPFFERKNTMRSAQARNEAANLQMEAAHIRLRAELKALHSKAVLMTFMASEVESTMKAADNSTDLLNAFERGEIGIEDYAERVNELIDAKAEVLSTVKEAVTAVYTLRTYEK